MIDTSAKFGFEKLAVSMLYTQASQSMNTVYFKAVPVHTLKGQSQLILVQESADLHEDH